MWCERVVRNAADGTDLASPWPVEYVDIGWDQCRSTLKAQTRGGEEVRVLLPRGQILRHGDVLFEDAARSVVVNVLPCELIVVRSDNPRRLAELALELGNLHWPTQVADDAILFVEEGNALAAVQRIGLSWTRETRRFEPMPILATAVRTADSVRVIRPAS
ncbi:MAG TPA: urease accessory protein UreE [Tepidisphaeraceae bacterium]|jgi:urease accessory protein UreE